jgi:uncharacterized protein (DUF885 family)
MLDRRSLLLTTGAAGVALGLDAALPALARAQTGAKPPIERLFDRYADQMLWRSPETATALGLDVGAHAAEKSQLDDRSAGVAPRDHAQCRVRLNELTAIDPAGLSDRDHNIRAAFIYANQLAVDADRFGYGDNSLSDVMSEGAAPYVVTQQSGAFNGIPDFLDSQHSIETAADAEAYLARLEAFGVALDQETERVRHDAGLGVTLPNFLLATTLKQMTAFRTVAASDSTLVDSIARRTKAKALAGDWAGRASALVQAKVYPALDRQIAALTAAGAKASGDAGMWRLPDGEAYYAWLLQVGTSTAMTPDEVHALGLEQIKAIGARMDPILRAQGLTQGSVAERMIALGKDPRNLYPNTDDGRAQELARLNQPVAGARAQMPKLSRLKLKADVLVKRVPPEIELGAGLGYMVGGPLDGSRPSIYYINLHDTGDWPRYSLPTLTYHETIPGHVWQGEYITETPDLPLLARMMGFNAYFEGWALYAEQLADEIGLYDDDPLGRLGYLQEQMLRACRLVADTGLHAKRWTRQQAIDFMFNGCGEALESMTSEIDRYCAGPGQACGYKIGQTQILAMRARAQARLGARFDLRDFNDAVLTAGVVPFNVLSDAVDRYIARSA